MGSGVVEAEESGVPHRARALRRAGLTSLLLLPVALAGCGSSPVRQTLPPYRFRMVAEVETPEGVKTGSSVIEVQWSTPPPLLGGQGSADYRMKGEAVAIDLPNGQTLFVLLSSPTKVDWAPYALEGTGILRELTTAEGADPGVRPVPRTKKYPWGVVDNYPYFVRFRNATDPKTVERVDPDDLAKSFGAGTKLKALTVQLTSDPISRSIYRRLPWLRTQVGSLVKYPRLTPIGDIPEERRLNEGAFVREDSQ